MQRGTRRLGVELSVPPKGRGAAQQRHPGGIIVVRVSRRERIARAFTRATTPPNSTGNHRPAFNPLSPACGRGSVQQGLSAAGGALGFCSLGLAADKRYSFGMKLQNPIALAKQHARLLWYYIAVEAIYILYELALMRGIHDGNGLALGLVLTFLTLPSVLIVGWLQWHAAELLGYIPGDTHAFWPRFIAWQVPIFLNSILFAFWATRRTTVRSQDVGSKDAG